MMTIQLQRVSKTFTECLIKASACDERVKHVLVLNSISEVRGLLNVET